MKDNILTILLIISFCLIIGLFVVFVNRYEKDNQLQLIETSGDYKIYYDKETKVEYIKEIGRDGGLTVRLDKNGKPMLYNEKEER